VANRVRFDLMGLILCNIDQRDLCTRNHRARWIEDGSSHTATLRELRR